MSDPTLSSLPPYLWPLVAQSTFLQVDPGVLLAADAAGNGVRVGASTVIGGNRGIFALRQFEVGERLLPFFGQVIHHDLDFAASGTAGQTRERSYGSGSFWTTARTWGKSSVEMPTSYKFWRGSAASKIPPASCATVATKRCLTYCPCFRSVWLVPALCCAAGIVNDYRHVHNADLNQRDQHLPQRQANTELVQRWDPITTADELTQYGTTELLVTRVIVKGQEMFMDYGPDYGYFSL